MHTRASIELTADKKTAILTLNGKRLRASLTSSDGNFEIRAAEPMEESATVDGQASNSGFNKLCVKVAGKSSTTICVEFSCIYKDSDLTLPTSAVVPLMQ